MAVYHILKQFGAKAGLNANSTGDRTTMLRFLNEAAPELYDQSDVPGSVMEQMFKVNGDQTISCPWYVGKIRAMREYNSQAAWSVNQLRPRYNQFNWTDMWRNFRLKNTQALMASVTNQSVGVLTVHAVENPPVVINVSGPTDTASNATESVTMDAISKSTVNQYTDYTAVTKDRINNYDITLSDVDGKVLTVIPNNRLTAEYQIVDVSLCPWLSQSTSQQDHYLEILYKKTLPYLFNDSDEFPAIGYDYILVNKMMQLWSEEQGKLQDAMTYDMKATRSMARKTEDQNRATEDCVSLTANPHDTLLPRIRQGRRKYYRGYGARGYGY